MRWHWRQTTHSQSASSACASPTEESLTVASRSVSGARRSRLTTAEWTLETPHLWTCHCADGGRRHCHQQSQSHWHRSLRTLSSAVSPTSPAADHSAPTATTSNGLSQCRTRSAKPWQSNKLLTNFTWRDSIYDKPQFCLISSRTNWCNLLIEELRAINW